MITGYETRGEWAQLPEPERARRIGLHGEALRRLITGREPHAGASFHLLSLGLAPDDAPITLRFSGGRALAYDGPFAETKEFIAGLDVADFLSREDAVAYARACCSHDGHYGEVRAVHDAWMMHRGPARAGVQSFALFMLNDRAEYSRRSQAELDACAARRGRVALEYVEERGARGEPLGWIGVRLAAVDRPAMFKIERGKFTQCDGPFAETRELIGGLIIVDCESRNDAVRWAEKLFVHDDDVIEVREVRSVWSNFSA
jgi:hypothetical protein